MSAIITSKHRNYLAELFKNQFVANSSRNMYFFVGKSLPWTNDISPDTTQDTIVQEAARWQDMLSMKKILETDVSYVIRRYDWDDTGETIYVPYNDSDVDLYEHPTSAEQSAGISGDYTAGSFYVMTDEMNVYKCLDNAGDSKSTDKPTGKSTSIIETSDGYKWKYMFTISSSDVLKFVNDSWIPIKTLTEDDGSNQFLVQEAAVDGAIDIINVTNGGSGYVNTYSGVVSSGSGSTIVLPNSASSSNDVFNNSAFFVTTGTGSGQYGTIATYTGSTRTCQLSASLSTALDGTSEIVIVPRVVISGNGTGAVARSHVTGGVITGISMVAAGSGYRVASVSFTGGGGSNAAASPVLSPIGGHGSDAVKELGGYYVMINVRTQSNESDFPLNNDFRRIGILRNVCNYGTTTIATDSTLRASKGITIASVSGTFQRDEVITSNGSGSPQAKIVEVTDLGGGSYRIDYVQDSTTGFLAFAGTETITGSTSGATATISSINNPEVAWFVGDQIWVENRRPILRASNQTESIRVVFEY